jgi:UDPglucose 6-dehydrogenase
MKIGIVGLSHLGIVTGLGLAARGFELQCYDPDAQRVRELHAGTLPIYEPQLEELLSQHSARISFSNDLSALSTCSLVYLARDVPTDSNNVSDLRPILALLSSLLPVLQQSATLVIHCQVSPGFTRKLTARLTALQRQDLQVYYQVETLIFGRAVERALQPERYIVGCADPRRPFPVDYQQVLAAGNCPILPMRYESAELAKIAINLFLISTLSTAGFLAEVCEHNGADWQEIAPALRLDKRIGPHAYLQPGLGFAGGNLERDVVTVLSLAAEFGCEAAVPKSWLLQNEYRKHWVLRLLQSEVYRRNPEASLALWGLTYKPDTHSVKNSPALLLLEQLRSKPLAVFDPRVTLASVCESESQQNSCTYTHWRQAQDCLDCVQSADALLILTAWPEFAEVSLQEIKERMRGRVVIDPLALLDQASCQRLGFDYYRMGASPL